MYWPNLDKHLTKWQESVTRMEIILILLNLFYRVNVLNDVTNDLFIYLNKFDLIAID